MGNLGTTRADVSQPHTPHELSLGFSSSSTFPSGPPRSQEGLSHPCRAPGLGCTVWCLTCSVPSADTISLSSESPPGNRGPDCLFFFSCPVKCVSFSVGCVGALLLVSSYFSLGIIVHSDVFLMCSWREVSSMCSYSAP